MTAGAVPFPGRRVPARRASGKMFVCRASLVLFSVFCFACSAPSTPPAGPSPSVPAAFRILHTAYGLGEISPCG